MTRSYARPVFPLEIQSSQNMSLTNSGPFIAVIRRRTFCDTKGNACSSGAGTPGYVVDRDEGTVWAAAYTNAITNLGMNEEQAGNFADEAVRMR